MLNLAISEFLSRPSHAEYLRLRTRFCQIRTIRSTVITATSVSYGKNWKFDPCKIETLEQIDTQFVRIDYVQEMNVCSKFGKNPLTGDFWAKGW